MWRSLSARIDSRLDLPLPDGPVTALIVCAVVYFIGPNLGGPQWGSLLGDLVPEARRGRFFALRTQLSSFASFSSLIVAGLVLEAFDRHGLTYWGFLTLFGVAAGLRVVSAYHLEQMHDPPGHVAALEAPPVFAPPPMLVVPPMPTLPPVSGVVALFELPQPTMNVKGMAVRKNDAEKWLKDLDDLMCIFLSLKPDGDDTALRVCCES